MVEEKRFRTGEEILEHFVPGYLPPAAAIDDECRDSPRNTCGQKLVEKVLSGLKGKLDQAGITKSGS